MEEAKEKRLAAKRTFFNELHKVHNEETETEDEDENEAVKFLSEQRKGSEFTKHKTTHISDLLPLNMGRTMSSPLPRAKVPPSRLPAVSFVRSTPHGASSSHMQPANQNAISAKPTSAHVPRGEEQTRPGMRESKKRKRGKSLEPLSESQQIFKGKTFFFIPNDSIAPARALRIRRVQEWGAIRTQLWGDSVTHIIAESYLCYEDVLKYLKITTIPGEVVLVNEIYLSDCMMYKYLVNPLHDRYQLDGQKNSAIIPQTPTSSESSSLPLKENRRKLPPQTPSRTEGSDEVAATRQLELLAQQVSSRRAEEASRAARTSRPQDALDKAIEEAAEVEGLPLDVEYNGLVESFSNEDDSEGDAQNSPSRLPRDAVRPASSHWQNNFSCMQKHDGLDKSTLPNARTIEVLQKMAIYYERMQDKWRVLAYRKAIAALSKQPEKIATKAAALAIPGIGTRLADKIEEIVLTDRLRRLDNTTVDNPDDAVLQLFLAIYGVGFTQAQTWISQGHRTLASLLKTAILNANQRVGIEHYEDFLSRIPRAETEAHAAFLRKHLAAVCPTLELTVGGSYRRGATDSGDIDFLVTSQTRSLSALRTLLVDSLLPRLFAIRYLRTTLASCDPVKGTKWLGAACLPNVKEQIWRRVDILLVPWDEMGAALIYWTGNDIFNRSMRLLASKKGMRLNQHGLYKNVLRGPGRSKLTEGELVESASEKAIFERLSVPWRPPEHRIC